MTGRGSEVSGACHAFGAASTGRRWRHPASLRRRRGPGANGRGARHRFKEGGDGMARARRAGVLKRVPLSEVKDDLSRYLRRATDAPIVVTRHGKPAGVLIGFATEDDWFDYQLEMT